MSTHESITLAIVLGGAFVFCGIAVILSVRDRMDNRVCEVCGKRKVENQAHYEDEAIWGHDFKPLPDVDRQG